MASQRQGFHLFLSLMLARCTRGEYGAPFVIKYIVTHWTTFTSDFAGFCKGLVKAARDYCRTMGSTYLAHHDGLAAAFSGQQFLATLLKKRCRDNLCELANENKRLFARLLEHRGRTILTDEEYMPDLTGQAGRADRPRNNGTSKYLKWRCVCWNHRGETTWGI